MTSRWARYGWILTMVVGGTLAVLAVACGPAGGGDDDDSTGSDATPVEPGTLLVEPGDLTLEVEGGVAATQLYTVTFVDDNGDRIDVSDEAVLSLDHPWLGDFTGPTLTTATDRAGRTVVRATARGASGSANLTVHLTHIVVTPGTRPDAPDLFDAATPGGTAPTVVYPEAGIIVPPNLNVIEFHYLAGGQNDLFRLAYVGSTITLEVYTTCAALGTGCAYEPSEDVWLMLAEASRGEDAVFFTLSGIDADASPALVGSAGARAISFGKDDLTGGIYYWNAGAGAIMRYDFGRRGQVAERFIDQAKAGATTCVGCHAISRNGTRIAVGLDIPSPAVAKTFEVSTRTELWAAGTTFDGQGSNFFAFNPDATQMISSNGATLVLRDAVAGTVIASPLVDNASMPDWSPDGSQIVFARPSTPAPCFPPFCGAPGVDGASILVATAGVWNDQTVVVPSGGQNNYYPAFSPDGEWILFNRSPSNTNSFDAPDAQVWVVHRSGGNPIRLANASPGPQQDSWPKWAPFKHTYRGGTLYWLTFSSRRDYGLRLVGQAQSQVWMVGFDPAMATAGMDGSYPAFWLPFQELASGNHIAQWVEEVNRQPCMNDEECEATEFCEEGSCVPYVE